MAGAAVIAAIANAVGGRDFPFVFGGDGASFAVSPADAGIARQALAETATWVREDLDLTLRVGMVSVGEIRRNGHDVRVGRYAVSDNISIAMFSGGGVAWADAAMKRDEISVPRAPAGARPDLSGLSCRFEQFPTQYGQILSVLVLPADIARMSAFRAVVKQIISMVEGSAECASAGRARGHAIEMAAAGLRSRSAGQPKSRRAGRHEQNEGLCADLSLFPHNAVSISASAALSQGNICPRWSRTRISGSSTTRCA